MSRIGRSSLLCVALAGTAATLSASNGAGYSLEVVVDGAAVPEYAARNRLYVEAVKGKDFVLRVSNPTGRRVAVALSVDGRNVIDAKRTGSREAAKWVLGPWETIEVPGWQVSGQTARRFFFTETSKSYAKWLGDTANVGTIEAVFYRERLREEPRPMARYDKDAPAKQPQAQEGASGRDEMRLREQASPPPSAKTEEKPQRADDSYAATGIGDATDFPVQWVVFEAESAPAARVAIRYEFRTELVRLGVLPRNDDLLARDHARGFEPQYAPDPSRR
jgi:hypothetical protein